MTINPPAPEDMGAFREEKHKRGLAWLWWLLAVIAALIIAAIIVALVHHNSHSAKSTSASPRTSTAGASAAGGASAGTAAGAGAAASGSALVGGGGAAPTALSGNAASAGTAGIVLFASASAAIDSNGQQVIAAAAQRIKTSHGTTATVVGYTDVIAGQAVNNQLSQQRADSVAAALRSLVGSGVTVTTTAKGQADPVASNTTDAGRAQNRRATIATH